jgi:hypothetical protein
MYIYIYIFIGKSFNNNSSERKNNYLYKSVNLKRPTSTISLTKSKYNRVNGYIKFINNIREEYWLMKLKKEVHEFSYYNFKLSEEIKVFI